MKHVATLILLSSVLLLVVPAAARAQGRPPLQEGDHPSVMGVLGGSLLGGLGAAAVGGIALGAAAGDLDCYEGGCAALILAGAAWPIGTAIGARWAVRRQGFDVGMGRMLLYSTLATGVGVAGLLVVEQFEGGAGTGPSDWTYAFASVGASLATLVLLTHFTVTYHEDDTTVSLAPTVTRSAFGLRGTVRLP